METSVLASLNGARTESATQQQSRTGFAEDFDNFLTLLTTQLQNQDPLDPTDTTEFTNQLVAFAEVEQSIRQSGLLEDQIAVERSNQAIGAVSYIGKDVEADVPVFEYSGEGGQPFSFDLPENAARYSVQIENSAGRLVQTSVGEAIDGQSRHFGLFSGQDFANNQLPAGIYSIRVFASNEDGVPVEEEIPVYNTARVTGVDYSEGATRLQLGGISVDLERVSAVLSPQTSAEDQNQEPDNP